LNNLNKKIAYKYVNNYWVKKIIARNPLNDRIELKRHWLSTDQTIAIDKYQSMQNSRVNWR